MVVGSEQGDRKEKREREGGREKDRKKHRQTEKQKLLEGEQAGGLRGEERCLEKEGVPRSW